MGFKHTHKRQAGFTMVEMLLVVSVIAIVLTMAFPDFIGFFRLQQERQEEAAMEEIQRALESYASVNGMLPASAVPSAVQTWHEEIAEYTHLSEENILNDVYGNPRIYKRLGPEVRTYRDADLDVYYAVVISQGTDGCFGDAAACDEATRDAYYNARLLDVDNGDENDLMDYVQLEPEQTDHMVKFTDLKLKLAAYDTTSERMEKVSEALENYARTMLNEAVIADQAVCEARVTAGDFNNLLDCLDDHDLNLPCAGVAAATTASGCMFTAPAESFLYYPMAEDDGGDPDANGNYRAEVRVDAANFISGTGKVDNSGNETDRRTAMQELMRLLGLPESYCCTPLERVDATNDGVNNPVDEKPLYYYSNPRVENGGACTARSSLATTKLPPRLSVDADPCG